MRRLFTVEEYHRMAEAGILAEDERVELIDGDIVEMAPIGTRHLGCVINLTRLFVTRLGDRPVRGRSRSVISFCSDHWRSPTATIVRRQMTSSSLLRSPTRRSVSIAS